jgi:hypothetical protein
MDYSSLGPDIVSLLGERAQYDCAVAVPNYFLKENRDITVEVSCRASFLDASLGMGRS